MEFSAPTESARQRFFSNRADWLRRSWAVVVLLFAITALPGCAAFRPLNGIPARYLPQEYEGETRSGKRTIDLSLLRQNPPESYLLDQGDVLGVYIEGVLGNRNEAPPVHFPQDEEVAPALGFPIPVREDGTISLPLIGAVDVRGLTVRQVEELVREKYTVDQQLLQQGRDRILISVLKPRTYQVLVIRQEQGGLFDTGNAALNLGTSKRGTGQLVTLAAYKNDVLHALAETGGLPGLDAENTIYVIRSQRRRLHSVPAPVDGHVPQPEASGPTLSQTAGWTSMGAVAPASYTTGSPPTASSIRPASNIEYTNYRSRVQPAIAYRTPGTSAGVQPINGNATTAAATPSAAPRAVPSGRYGHNWTYPQTSLPYPTDTYTTAPFPYSTSPATGPTIVPEANWPDSVRNLTATVDNARVIKIPVRLHDGDVVNLSEQDVILDDGDIVFIESRETEIYYTGGLLGGGQYTLPRDYDLDVIGAISIAQGRGATGNRSAAGPSSLNQDVDVSASNVVILRQLDNGTQIPIKVDLYDALRNPAERVLIQPRDIVILQYTPLEAIGAFVERHLLEGALFGLAASQVQANRN